MPVNAPCQAGVAPLSLVTNPDDLMVRYVDYAPSGIASGVGGLIGEWRVVLAANDTECRGRVPA